MALSVVSIALVFASPALRATQSQVVGSFEADVLGRRLADASACSWTNPGALCELSKKTAECTADSEPPGPAALAGTFWIAFIIIGVFFFGCKKAGIGHDTANAGGSASGAFHLFRKVTTEILLILSLTTAPVCQSKLQALCVGGGNANPFNACCAYSSFFDFKKYFGIFGASVATLIMLIMMFCYSGKYFPGSVSNDYYEWVNGQAHEDKTMSKTIGKDDGGKITLCQKFMLGITGYVLGISLLLELWSGFQKSANAGCDGDFSGAVSAYYLAIFAYVGKAKELFCYYILFCAYCLEYALYLAAIVIYPGIRGFDSRSEAMCATSCRKLKGQGTLEGALYSVYGFVWANVG
jgi:hypothetical protein